MWDKGEGGEAEGRGQRSEVGRQRSEGRGQKAEVRRLNNTVIPACF